MGVLLTITSHHIVPCLLASIVIAGLLALLFGSFRIRRPRDRALFLYASLGKAALALWVGSGLSCLIGYPRLIGYAGLRLPDVSPDSSALLEAPSVVTMLTGSTFSGRVALLVVAAAAAFLAWRWIRLAPFLHRITTASPGFTENTEVPAQLLDELMVRGGRCPRWQRSPRVVVVAPDSLPVLTVGIRSPVIVLPADLAAELGERELRALLAHELAHIRRLDYGGRWIAAMLRDVMAWNPFAHIWFRRLVSEQERAADEWASDLLGDPQSVASALVEAAAHARRLPLLSLGPLGAWGRARAWRELEARVGALGRDPWPRAAWYRWVNLWALLAFFVVAQPHLAVSIPWLSQLLAEAG
jgi:Zn-dependent protease with chaperone function